METNPDILAARAKLFSKKGGEAKIGGKGTARRKVKAKHVASVADDKKLQGQMKKLGVNTIPGIEEVNMFTEDNQVIHFDNPRVQASYGSNTYVVSGSNETKPLQDMLPQIISQLGPDNLMSLQKMLSSAGGLAAMAGKSEDDAKDAGIPDLDGNFEDISKE